jgi:hypothetical protein
MYITSSCATEEARFQMRFRHHNCIVTKKRGYKVKLHPAYPVSLTTCGYIEKEKNLQHQTRFLPNKKTYKERWEHCTEKVIKHSQLLPPT